MESNNDIYKFKVPLPKNAFLNRSGGRIKIIQDQNFKAIQLFKEKKAKTEIFDLNSLKQKNYKLQLFRNKKICNTDSYPSHFEQVILHQQILDNLSFQNFSEMTPIQRLSIPSIIEGEELVGCAQTGSGKTIAYLVPIATRLLLEENLFEIQKEMRSYPLVLVILPTRELAKQTYNESIKIFYRTNIISTVIYGGVDYQEQTYNLKKGCDVVIGTPGRLLNYLDRGLISLSEVNYLVIDEADEMLDMGFEPDIEQIIFGYDLKEHQTLMFSATFPKKVVKMINQYMKDQNYYYISSVGSDFQDEKIPNMTIDQRFYYINSLKYSDKVEVLDQLLQIIKGKTLIFVNTKRDTDWLVDTLMDRDYCVGGIHGDMSQNERKNVMEKFFSGNLPLLIATDVASRGLDIPKIDFVINFDMPNNIDDYVHRIGRTGRCGLKGRSLTLLTANDRVLFPSIIELLHKSNQKIPEFLYTK